ncbi:OmpP1/FadL family transporter [Pedobacter alpinus]|uniref:OmpP1/FadL family transporter n=1 Tax=Pedobacter alpinus TaxID=1590643 RepID=A0ABW5TTU0_9SPHI
MKLKKQLLLAVFIIIAQTAFSQYTADALRFSQFENSTTARFGGMGGQKAAIGGDISSVYGNPAGLGMFSKSEFSLTPEIRFGNSDVNFLGTDSKLSNSNVDLSNVGVVFHTRTYKEGDLKKGLLSLNFGIGYQKRAAYKNNYSFAGETNLNGLGDFFAQESNADRLNGTPRAPEDLISNVNNAAFVSFLTDYNAAGNPNYFPITFTDTDQTYDVLRSGGSSDVNFSVGTNFSNKVFFGASVGLSSFRYTSMETTNEQSLYVDPNNGNSVDYNVNYARNFDTEGSGVNLKLGLILKPTKELRVGLNFESPTWFRVTDNYSEEFSDRNTGASASDSYPFEYNLNTPLKLNGGLAYFFSDKGFLSADVGFVDYSSIKFSSNNSSQDVSSNRDIMRTYQNVLNYSVGGEIKLDESFLLRAGFQSSGNPYKDLNNSDYTINSFSGGIGYRFGEYYLDAALINSNNFLEYRNYALNNGNEPRAGIETRTNRVSITFGVRF